MAIPHAPSGHPIDVRPFGNELPSAQTVALFKTDELEVIRMVFSAGKTFPPHKVAGATTIQCIEGRIEVSSEDCTCTLEPGQLLYLPGNMEHGVLALEDASALVTIILPD